MLSTTTTISFPDMFPLSYKQLSFCMRIQNDTTYILHQKHYNIYLFVSLGTHKLLFYCKHYMQCTYASKQTYYKQNSKKSINSQMRCISKNRFTMSTFKKNQDVNMHIAHSYHNNKCTFHFILRK